MRRRRSVARKARRRLLLGIGGGAIALALILGLIIPSIGNIATPTSDGANTGNLPSVGTQTGVQDGGVIEPGAEHEPYATLPPTSGRATPPARRGAYMRNPSPTSSFSGTSSRAASR